MAVRAQEAYLFEDQPRAPREGEAVCPECGAATGTYKGAYVRGEDPEILYLKPHRRFRGSVRCFGSGAPVPAEVGPGAS